MQRRSTYPSDPFDMLVSSDPEEAPPRPSKPRELQKVNKPRAINKPKGSKRQERAGAPEAPTRSADDARRLKNETFGLPVDLMDWARNAVYFTPGLTLSGLVEASLREHLGRLEKDRGEQFPDRPGRIKTGRPMRS
jgi:hypothetical protein